MGKRKAQQPPEPPTATDYRAAQLRAHVEALARQPEALSTNVSSADVDAFVAGKPSGPQDRRDPSLPMLIRTTDTGVYLKWSIMLQDQLARMKSAYEGVCEENAILRQRLGMMPASTMVEADASGRSLMPPNVSFAKCSSDSALSAASAISAATCDIPFANLKPQVDLAAAAPGAAPPCNKLSAVPMVNETPTVSDLVQHAADAKHKPAPAQSEAVDLGSGAAALIALASPKPSPRSETERTVSPGSMPPAATPSPSAYAAAVPTPMSNSSLNACIARWPNPDAAPSAAAAMPPPTPAASMPPPSALPSMGEWSPAIGHRIPGFSPDINGKSEDDILADLLLSPNLLSSPQLSSSIKAYLESRGNSNQPSPMLTPRPRFQPGAYQQPGPQLYGRAAPIAHSVPLAHMQQSQLPAFDKNLVSARQLQHAQPTPAAPYFSRRAGTSWQTISTQAVGVPKV